MNGFGYTDYGEWNDGDGQLGEDISIPGEDGLGLVMDTAHTSFVETPQTGTSNAGEVILVLGGLAGLLWWWNNSK